MRVVARDRWYHVVLGWCWWGPKKGEGEKTFSSSNSWVTPPTHLISCRDVKRREKKKPDKRLSHIISYFIQKGLLFFARLAAWGSLTWMGENNITRKNGGGGGEYQIWQCERKKTKEARKTLSLPISFLGGRLQAGTTVFQEEDAVDVVCEKGIKKHPSNDTNFDN